MRHFKRNLRFKYGSSIMLGGTQEVGKFDLANLVLFLASTVYPSSPEMIALINTDGNTSCGCVQPSFTAEWLPAYLAISGS